MSENGSMTTHKILAARKDTKLDLYLRFFFGDQGLLKLLRWYFRFLFQPGSLLYVSRDSDVLSIVAALCCFLPPAQQWYFIFPPSILPAPSHPQNKTYRCLLNRPGFAGAACPLFAFLLGCFWPCKSSIAQLKTKWGRAQGVNRKDRHPTNSPPYHLWSDWCSQAPWLVFHILSPDDGPAHSRQPPRSAPCLCRPCSGEQEHGSWWRGGQGKGACGCSHRCPVAAGCNCKGWGCALSLVPCSHCSRNKPRPLSSCGEDAGCWEWPLWGADEQRGWQHIHPLIIYSRPLKVLLPITPSSFQKTPSSHFHSSIPKHNSLTVQE